MGAGARPARLFPPPLHSAVRLGMLGQASNLRPSCVCSHQASVRQGSITCAPKRPVLPASAPPAVRAAFLRLYPPVGAPVHARPPGFSQWSISSGDVHRTRSAHRGPSAPAWGGRPTLWPAGTGHHYAQQPPMDPRPKDQGAVLRVEPRGFEPLTSAVQRRVHTVVAVRLCSKTPANKHILSYRFS